MSLASRGGRSSPLTQSTADDLAIGLTHSGEGARSPLADHLYEAGAAAMKGAVAVLLLVACALPLQAGHARRMTTAAPSSDPLYDSIAGEA